MKKSQRKQIEELLFQVYDKGCKQEDCNLTDYYEKIQQALNKPLVSKREGVEREALLRDYTDWLWLNHNILTNANNNETALKQYLSRNSC